MLMYYHDMIVPGISIPGILYMFCCSSVLGLEHSNSNKYRLTKDVKKKSDQNYKFLLMVLLKFQYLELQ